MNISATNYFYTEVKLCGVFFAALNLLNLINVALSIKKNGSFSATNDKYF